LTIEQRQTIAAAMELYQPYLLEPEQDERGSHGDHSSLPEPEPELSHSDETEPVESNYSAEERERRLQEIYQSIYDKEI
jgi:hypothetical protein